MIKKKKYRRLSILLIILTLVAIAFLMSFSQKPDTLQFNSDNISGEMNFPQDYQIVTPKFPLELNFCDEIVPVENFDVFERLEREFIVNTYWHSLTILTMKRANRWFPVIEPILEEYGIPNDFKYLCITESTLLNLTSPANAVGYWQFLKGAGKEYGLIINGEVDERYNIEKSTEAAYKYLLDAYELYGNWTMAAASYNMGMNGINEQLERQKTNNYYNLVLGEETSRYVFRIIATKYIMESPSNYGFNIPDEELYEPYDSYYITVDSAVASWADFAFDLGLNYKILKLYNPWLRENYLTNKEKRSYKIKVPHEGSISKVEELPNSKN